MQPVRAPTLDANNMPGLLAVVREVRRTGNSSGDFFPTGLQAFADFFQAGPRSPAFDKERITLPTILIFDLLMIQFFARFS